MTYEKVKKKGHSMYFAFIDFKKAYDSIDRQNLIEVLIGFNINPLIIELIVQMYQEDCTIIKLGKMNRKVEVTSGIREAEREGREKKRRERRERRKRERRREEREDRDERDKREETRRERQKEREEREERDEREERGEKEER